MKSLRLSSIQQAAKAKRLDTIAIAAQRAAFKAQGGTVENIGVTTTRTIGLKRVHQMAVMPTR